MLPNEKNDLLYYLESVYKVTAILNLKTIEEINHGVLLTVGQLGVTRSLNTILLFFSVKLRALRGFYYSYFLKLRIADKVSAFRGY